jgi:hypothetical protein
MTGTTCAVIGVGPNIMGRYAQYGPAICVIAVGAVSIGVIFLVIAARLVQRSDVACVLITATVAAAFSESQSFGEPIFTGNSLDRGVALFLAVLGILLGVGGVILSQKLRLLRVLILVAASATLFGDVAGWIRRSAGPSKYDDGGSSSSAPLWRKEWAFRKMRRRTGPSPCSFRCARMSGTNVLIGKRMSRCVAQLPSRLVPVPVGELNGAN